MILARTCAPLINRTWPQRFLRARTWKQFTNRDWPPRSSHTHTWAQFINRTWPASCVAARFATRFATRNDTRFANRFGRPSSTQTCRHQPLAIGLLLCLEGTGAR